MIDTRTAAERTYDATRLSPVTEQAELPQAEYQALLARVCAGIDAVLLSTLGATVDAAIRYDLARVELVRALGK